MDPEHPIENYPTPNSISEKQLAANRANAAQSTGPATDAGKRASARNAYKHGLTAQTVLMSSDEHERHATFTAEYTAALKPDNIIERDLAESIAEAAYRLKRAVAMDHNLYALAEPAAAAGDAATDTDAVNALARAQAFLNHTRQFQLLTVYENRIRRNMQKDIDRLEKLQAERREAWADAMREAELLSQLANAQGKLYNPAEDFPNQNGFVFSVEEINAWIRRDRRIYQATQAEEKFYKEETLQGDYIPHLIDLPTAA